MDSMYDRLGDLLKETLDAGEIRFVKLDDRSENLEAEKKVDVEESIGIDKTDFVKKFDATKSRLDFEYQFHKAEPTATVYHAGDFAGHTQEEYKPKNLEPKLLNQQVQWAFRVLSIPTDSDFASVKKAYLEKIKYYHPDKYAGNAVLQKVATEKTKQILESYRLIMDFLGIEK